MLGCKFEQLAKIIEGVEDKSRVGVCIDTCKDYVRVVDTLVDSEYFAGHLFASVVFMFILQCTFHLTDDYARDMIFVRKKPMSECQMAVPVL